MAVLVIDNYDSYTYNLVDLLHQVTGRAPIVLQNDAYPSWAALCEDLDPAVVVEAVVLSPGPGRPDLQRDFGLCREAISSGLPVLGVCLGHQGLASAFGGVVIPARAGPRHGIPSPVRFLENEPLFKGLTQRFMAMRYHSLEARLCEGPLVPIAWADDDHCLMALKHTSLPLYGLQFHPESIATQFGRRIIANFIELAGVQVALGAPPPKKPPVTTAARRPKSVLFPERLTLRHRLVTELRVFDRGPAIFEALGGEAAPGAFWLDSGPKHEPCRARFSFLGNASGPHSRLIHYKASPEPTVSVIHPQTNGQGQVHRTSIFDFLDNELAFLKTEHSTSFPFDFDTGFVGHLGYELKAETTNGRNVHSSKFPDAGFVFADRLVVLDHLKGTVYLLCLSLESESPHEANHWMNCMEATLRDSKKPPVSHQLNPTPPKAPVFVLERNKEEYCEDINKCLNAIRRGESYEVCLTNRIRTTARPSSALHLYRHLREINPAPHSAFLKVTEESALCCSSPECFLKVRPSGLVSSRPIKGTEPRGRTPQEDQELKRQLSRSIKDRAENLMVVDLVRNDLTKVCQPSTIAVPSLVHVESYETVHQMVSTVSGELREGCTAVSAVRAAFPMGSMTGAPKMRTMEIIDSLEQSPRGIYSGAVGYFGICGGLELNVVIRSAIVSPGGVEIGVGGAIVAISDPEKEWREVLLKGEPIMRAIAASVGETSFVLDGVDDLPRRTRNTQESGMQTGSSPSGMMGKSSGRSFKLVPS